MAVRLEFIEWEPGGGDRMTARGRDCLGTLVRELKHLGQQRVLRARFLFHFKKTRHDVGVTLRSSHGIKCTRESDRLEIEALLGHMGLLGSSLAAPFWEFAGRPRPACRWRRALGGRFDVLLAEGFLLDAALDAAPDETCSAADGALRLVEGMDDVGMGVDPDTPPRRLKDDALDGYSLNLAVLLSHLRRALKLTEMPVAPLPDGVVQVGRREMRGGPIRVFLAVAPPGDMGQTAALLRDRAGGIGLPSSPPRSFRIPAPSTSSHCTSGCRLSAVSSGTSTTDWGCGRRWTSTRRPALRESSCAQTASIWIGRS